MIGWRRITTPDCLPLSNTGIRKADMVKVETMSPEPCAVRLSAADLRPGLEMQGVGLEVEAGPGRGTVAANDADGVRFSAPAGLVVAEGG